MTRPRLAAMISAIAASTVAFLVVHRWSLAGTLTGAAVVPFVYTLVSHWSTESLDRLNRLAQKHLRRGALGGQDLADEAGFAEEVGAEPLRDRTGPHARTIYLTRGTAPSRTGPRLQWALAAATILAFAFSVYSFAAAGPTERIVVQKQVEVVEKTVYLSSGSGDGSGSGSATVTSTPSTTTPSQDQDPTTTTSVPAVPATTVPATEQPEGTP